MSLFDQHNNSDGELRKLADHNMNSAGGEGKHANFPFFPRFPFLPGATEVPTIPLSLNITGQIANDENSPKSAEYDESPKSSPTGQTLHLTLTSSRQIFIKLSVELQFFVLDRLSRSFVF